MKARLERLLCSRAFLVVAVVLAIALLLPTLRVGFMMDDWGLPLWLRGGRPAGTGGPRGIWDLFRFQDADRPSFLAGRDVGFWPWWSNPELQLAFFRPLTSLTHALDFRLFPQSPALMRLESILVYGGVVAVAGLLYRRFQGATVAAGLALLMYALDDAHGIVTSWISNRNAVLAALFGFLALLFHDKAVRESDRRARIVAPVLFALALLAGEAALATLAYLAAHALWMQKDRVAARVKALAPYAAITLAWSIPYHAAGYGASGGEFYIDPGKEPARFLGALSTRLPVLLHGQFGFPPSDAWMLVPMERQRVALAIVIAMVLLGAAVLALGVRRTRENAFYATGMLLALVPVCATFPSDRLLAFAGLGAFGLIGDFLTAPREELTHARRFLVRWTARFFVLLHIALAPVLYLGRALQLDVMLNDPIVRADRSLPSPAELAGKTIVVANGPDFLVPQYGLLARMTRGEPGPQRIRQLGIGVAGQIMLRRTGERTVELTMTKGFFHDAFSLVFRRANDPIALGDRVEIAGMTATVKAFTSDRQHVGTVEFAFDAPVDGASFVWVVWKGTKFERLVVPAVGEEVELPAIDYQQAMQG
jgi:hypothetical protein